MKNFSKDVISTISNFECLKAIHEPIIFSFSIYENGIPGSGITKSRKIFSLKSGDLESAVRKLTNQINENEELAINSKIKIGGKNYHLPIVDLNSDALDEFSISALQELQLQFPGQIYLFKSGRSYHAYQDALISVLNWKKFLGSLLLLNPVNQNSKFVDSRWIGHSLKQNFSALRLSHNTNSYLSLPILDRILQN